MTIMDYINKSNKICIVSHIRPDGDAIGSAFAMYIWLKNIGKDVHVIMSSYSTRFDFLEELEEKQERILEDEIDLAICVDCSDISRLDILPEDIAKAKWMVAIDHHKFSSIKCNASIIDEVSPANCEIIYKFMLENNIEITPKIATYLYMGLMTDTGSFNYDRTTSFTYKVAGDLIDRGADFVTVCKKLNDTMPESKMKLMTYVLENMQVYFDGKLRIAVVDKNVLDRLNVDKEDAEGMTNYLRMIKGTELAVYIREQDDVYKVSLRSDKYTDCADIAVKFGGGGHIRAAGFNTKDTEKTIEELKNIFKEGL